MGEIFSNNLQLMKRLVEVLGKTKHKVIVCKGPQEGQIELPANMYGRKNLPQTDILPHVQLVITHGGKWVEFLKLNFCNFFYKFLSFSNTVTESFIEGKPMIVLPLFADQ